MKPRYLAIIGSLMVLNILTGCQKQEPVTPPPEARSEEQLNNEYRALLADTGLLRDGTPLLPAQIEPGPFLQVLCVAAAHGSTEMLVRLLGARSDVGLNSTLDGRTMLHCAAASLHSTNSNLLLERGIDPNVQDSQGKTALHLVVPQKDGVNLARLLVARGARVDIRDTKGLTPLMLANAESIKLLADKGADLALQDPDGNTPLHWAAHRKAVDAAALLLYLGASPAVQNSAGKTPLHTSVENRDPAMTELFLRAGANPDTPDAGGLTPRQLADKTGNKILLSKFSHFPEATKGSNPK